MALTDEEFRRYVNELETSRDHFSHIDERIDTYRGFYLGDGQWRGADRYDYRFATLDNMIYSVINALRSHILFKDPKIRVRAGTKPFKKGEDIVDTRLNAFLMEIALGYIFEKKNKTKLDVNKSVLDAFIGPWGLMMIGNSIETEQIDKDLELLTGSDLFTLRISPKDLRIDPECTDPEWRTANWIAIRWVKRLDDVKEDSRYTDTEDLAPNFNIRDRHDNRHQHRSAHHADRMLHDDTVFDRVEGWDIWDRRDNKIITMVLGHQKELRVADWPLKYDGFPVENMYFNEEPDECYPLGEVHFMVHLQEELNRIGSLQLEHIRTAASEKVVYDRNKIDEDSDIAKLTYGPSKAAIPVDGDPSTAVSPLNVRTVNQDILLTRNMVKDAMRELTGVSALDQGNTRGIDTATEARLQGQSSQARKEAKRAAVEDYIIRIVTKMGKVLQQTALKMDIPLDDSTFNIMKQKHPQKLMRVKKTVNGPQGPQEVEELLPFVKIEKKDLQGDFEYQILTGSTQLVSSQERQQSAVFWYKTTAQDPRADKRQSLEDLAEAFDKQIGLSIKDEKVVQQQLQAQQKAQAEAGQAERKAKDQTDLQKTPMKSQTSLVGIQMTGEQAKELETLKQQGKLKETVIKESTKGKQAGKERLLKLFMEGQKSGEK